MRRQFPLRGLDCLSVIDHAVKWNSEAVHYTQLTIPTQHENSSIRIVILKDRTKYY